MCGCGTDKDGAVVQIKLGNVLDKCAGNVFDGLVDQVVKALLGQLEGMCPKDEEGQLQQDLNLGDCLPTCLSNTVRYAGRQFRRGMFDVENEGPPVLE